MLNIWIYGAAILAGILLSIGAGHFNQFLSYIGFTVGITFSVHFLICMWRNLLPHSNDWETHRSEKVAALNDGLKRMNVVSWTGLVIISLLAIPISSMSFLYLFAVAMGKIDTSYVPQITHWASIFYLALMIYPIFSVYALARYLHYRDDLKAYRQSIGE